MSTIDALYNEFQVLDLGHHHHPLTTHAYEVLRRVVSQGQIPTSSEIHNLLTQWRSTGGQLANEIPGRPQPDGGGGGLVFFYSNNVDFKNDGHAWHREGVTQKQTIKCYATHSRDVRDHRGAPLHRRCYWDVDHPSVVMVIYTFIQEG